MRGMDGQRKTSFPIYPNKYMKKLLTNLLLSATAFLAMVVPFQAAHAVDVQKEFATTLNRAGLIESAEASSIPNAYDVIDQIIFMIVSVTGVVIFVLVIYGGFMWATARGNDEQVKNAQQTIVRGVIGLTLVFSAYMISNFVLSTLSAASVGETVQTSGQ